MLRFGDRGADVHAMQLRLIAHGIFVSTDGYYGPKTEDAVRSFQRANGLKDDGVAGPVTMAALAKLAARVAPAPGETVIVHGLEMPAVRCWPLRALADGRRPIITSRHKMHEPTRPTHYGADLLYHYDAKIDPPTPVGDSGRTADRADRSKGYWVPPNTWAVACADGVVERCGSSPTGMFCWVRHAGGLATGGFHFDQLSVIAGQPVKMGDNIGRVNDSPRGDDPDHLHGELYQGGLVGAANTYPHGTLDPELWWLGAIVLSAR